MLGVAFTISWKLWEKQFSMHSMHFYAFYERFSEQAGPWPWAWGQPWPLLKCVQAQLMFLGVSGMSAASSSHSSPVLAVLITQHCLNESFWCPGAGCTQSRSQSLSPAQKRLFPGSLSHLTKHTAYTNCVFERRLQKGEGSFSSKLGLLEQVYIKTIGQLTSWQLLFLDVPYINKVAWMQENESYF